MGFYRQELTGCPTDTKPNAPLLVVPKDRACYQLPKKLMFEKILTLTATPVITGDEAYLNTFRFANGLPLPPSYIRFCQELGYGRLAGLFLIAIPLKNAQHPDSFQVQKAAMKILFDEYLDPPLDAIMQVKDGPELIRQAQPFAHSENGEFLFWDTRNPLPDGELPVYYTDFSGGIRHAGNSLTDLIRKITDPQDYRSVLYFNRAPLNPVFEPLTLID
jgi:hypothetical protein